MDSSGGSNQRGLSEVEELRRGVAKLQADLDRAAARLVVLEQERDAARAHSRGAMAERDQMTARAERLNADLMQTRLERDILLDGLLAHVLVRL